MSDIIHRSDRKARPVTERLLCGTSFAALILLALPSAAHAQNQDRHWDPNGTTVGTGGDGTWDASNKVWSPSGDGVSGPYTPWDNGALDNAIFEGATGTVTLTEPITVHNITFSSAGYTLTGGTLTLAGEDPIISVIGSTNGANIYSVIVGNAGLTKNLAGTLRLYGANTFTGDVFVNAGTLEINDSAALGDASNGVTLADGTALVSPDSLAGRTIILSDGQATISGAGVGSAHFIGAGGIRATGTITLDDDANDYTGPTTLAGGGNLIFSSIGDIGETSALGAPVDAASSKISLGVGTYASAYARYTGTGDSSNRDWQLGSHFYQTSGIVNQGTGTLTLTGDVVSAHTASSISVRNISFDAASADLALLGTISSNNNGVGVVFTGGGIGRTITVGGANTFGGVASIQNVTVKVNSLGDTGTASSLGTGTAGDIGIVNGVLSYTGASDSSDRAFVISGSSTIANDGSGALTLGGDGSFAIGGAADTLTLGGSFAGTSTLSGVLSGAGSVRSDGAGTWIIAGANSFTGDVIVDNGTLQAGNADAFGAPTGLTVNGGTLDLGGYDLTAPTLDGTGGTVALGANTLTIDAATDSAYAGEITGSGGLEKAGIGALTLSGANGYTGPTLISGGTLALGFDSPGAPTANIISAASTLGMAGGALNIIGADGVANSQSFNGLNITAGSNRISATSGAGGSVDVGFGAITRTGGLIDFVLPDSGSFTTTNTSLGGWATVNGSDYAKVVSGVIAAFTETDYTQKDDAADWLDGEVVSDVGGAADTPFFGTVSGTKQLGGLKYTAAADSTVTIGAGETLGIDGTIIVASSVGVTDQTISGGSLTGGVGGGFLGVLQNGGARFNIGSAIVDNGGATGFTKGGEGIVRLNGSSSYTGATILSGGELQVASLADAGVASSIGAASADSSNLVLESGMLHYVGVGNASTDRGFTLVNGGAEAPVIAVDAGQAVEFSGLVTSPDDAGLTKTGWGTLVLSNAANDYIGVTTIRGGGGGNYSTLSVNTLADGGAMSGIGAAGSDSANLVLSDGGRLEYTGATIDTDRGFTLEGSGRIAVADGAATLTIAGSAVGAGGLVKDGTGTLVLTGANTYTGGTVVNEGTLRAGAAGVFGSDTGPMGVNDGATLDLGGFDIRVGALRDGATGGGDVLLRTNTLTIGGTNGTFSGAISGTGGISVVGNTQTMVGCNNSYTGVTTINSTVTVDCLADGGQMSGIGAASSDPGNLLLNGTLDYTGGSVTIDRGFTTAGGQIVVRDATATLEITGATVGGGLIKDGAGTLVLSGSSTRNGTTRIENGTLRAGVADAFGSGRLELLNVAGVTADLAGFDSTIAYLSGGGAAGGNITLGSATLTLNGNGGVATYGGAISGSGGLIKNGNMNQTLSSCDSGYTGATVVNGGTLSVSCLTDGGTNSSIGASTGDAANLVINGGRFRYVGGGGSTDRQFTLGASGGNVLDAMGSGAIVFTSEAALTFSSADTAQTLTLSGDNKDNNVLAAQIVNNGTGETSLTKDRAGTWILTNQASTYTGVTRIDGGVLGVDKLADGGLASSLGASSADASNLIIGNGSTLRYTGAGDTTNRLFTLSAGTTFIESSGTGAIVFTDTGPVTLAGNNQSRTIALGGGNTGDNTLAGSIGDAGTGVTILAKNDAGIWVLTGDNTYSGNTVINDGTLKVGGGGTTGSIVSDTINLGTLVFDRSDEYTYDGVISNVGNVEQAGAGTTILTANSTYTGGTTIDAGALQLGDGGATGSIVGDVLNNGELAFNRSDTYAFGGLISGTGTLSQIGTGTTVLTASNTYTGGTTISTGTLQIGDGGIIGSIVGDVVNNAALVFDRSDTVTFAGLVSGTGSVEQAGTGTTVLTADNSYTGGTTISAGTLQLGGGGATGGIVGDVLNDGSLVFNRSDALDFAGLVSGTGSLTQNGTGSVTLTANNSYTGVTNVNAGTLLVNGDQSAATGLTSVASGAALGGIGTIGGDVTIADGGILAPGESPGTLTIAGNLDLSSGSVLNFEFGEAGVVGGALNDLVEVGGDLVLDGTINVTETAGGTFGGGIYRVFNYSGALTDNGLALGTMPGGSNVTVQTSVAGQVNLVNSAGLELSFWDGDAGPKFNDAVNGGNGTWHLNGTDNNWTDAVGGVNAAWADGTFAIFTGTAGTVTVDNSGGAVTASGMQFASDGYLVTGADLALLGPQSTIRVGDGTAAGAAYIATIDAVLTGNAQLVKTDLGTLVLSGANSYTGGTLISGGVLSVAADSNLGDSAGAITIDGGTLRLTNLTPVASSRAYILGPNDGAIEVINPTAVAGTSSAVTGNGGLIKLGAGTLVLGGANSYTGGTTIEDGTLSIGGNAGGSTTASIIGNVVNNGTLLFNRSNAYTYAGSITGTGDLDILSTGVTTLTGDSSYGGGTAVFGAGGELRIAGGAKVTSGGDTNMQRSTLSVDGAGSTFSTASIIGNIPGTGATVVQVTNGGTLRTTAGDIGIRALPNVSVQINIDGANSLADLAGGIRGSATFNAPFSTTVSAGGTLRTAGASQIGSVTSSTNPIAVAITGAGSNWTSGGSLLMTAGDFTVDQSGAASFTSATFGTAPQAAGLLVSGASSSFTTTGDLVIGSGTGTGALTLTDGARVDVGGAFTLADNAAAMGILNIGGAEGSAAAAAGVFDAPTLNLGSATSRVNLNHTDTDYSLASAISGAGAINQVAGVTSLTGDSSAFTGATAVSGGSLYVNNALGGNVTVATGGALGGIGTIGGTVTVADGALNPGDLGVAPGVLTINGNLGLAASSTINLSFGEANVVGGALNDLVNVGGDLTLDGTLNVDTSAGGSFDPGLYRVINYAGTLTDNGLTVGTIPSPDFYVQTSVAGQVNLVNTAGLTLRYWDGDTVVSKNNSLIEGGNGLWQASGGNDNWTEETGGANAPFTDSAFAVFMGAAGTVAVDNSTGQVIASGMQFLTDGYVIDGGAIDLAGASSTIRVGDGTAAGAGMTATIASALDGASQLVKADLGTLILTGTNDYTGGTAIKGGTLQISADPNLGDAAGGLIFDGGTLNATADITSSRAVDFLSAGGLDIDSGSTLALGGAISGAGGFTKIGDGTLILTGTNDYGGTTTVDAGTLFVNGNQSGAAGLTTVNTGATLGGTGTIGGDVALAGTLAAGSNGVGTLTINGSLALASGSTLDFEFGEAGVAGGSLNDLVNVGGDLVLNGTLNVSVPSAGSFDPGIYRVFNYGGSLTDNGLALGTMPGGDVAVQTAITGQVNLVNTAGLTLNFWDGDAGPKNNNAIDGGDGVWRVGGGINDWTDMNGSVNADYAQDSFAIFSAGSGTVTIDNVGGDVLTSGMQFANDGYVLTGDALTLTGIAAIIQVGDSSAAGAGYTATIDAELTGAAQLVKTDAGTLVLTGTNSYTGGTAINGGTVQIAADASLGDAAGGLSLDGGTLNTIADIATNRAVELAGAGTFLTDAGTTLTLGGAVSGAGSLTKDGAGALILTFDNDYAGGTTIGGGILQLGDGGTSGEIVGDVANDAALAFNRSDDVTFAGSISGSGSVSQIGGGTTILTADNSYTGGTTIGAGTLQLGDGGTSGSIVGDIVNNGTLAFNRSDDVTFAGLISGSGGLDQIGTGTTVLTGANSYAGATLVNAGTLLVNGDQSAATGLTTVNAGGTLGGTGTIGGDVALAGTLAAGGNGVGTLTINGDLALASGSTLDFEFGEAGVAGGSLNDLVNVGGDLVLDGTLNVSVPSAGSFGPGIYRVFNYGGALTDNGLALGTMPGSDVAVQTAIAGQVNLVNTAGLTLSFWDGTAGPKNNDAIDGGDGVWRVGGGVSNWTDMNGSVNADYAQGSFAIFSGASGTVTIDNSGGDVSASGMQFASDGYVLTGDALTLTGTDATIQVGDGSTAGAGYTATIDAELTGAARLVKTDAGTLVLTSTNSYTGGTAINGGTVRIAADANLGDAAGGFSLDGGTLQTTADIASSRTLELVGAGTFLTATGTTLTLNGMASGAGNLAKAGAGTLVLAGSGDNSGGINVGAGTLWVNGDFGDATGLTSVASGATLGGTGTIGGDVTLADGAILTPGAGGAGTLAIGGSLSLASGSALAFEFGEAGVAGGALNDLVTVGGDLTLDGRIDVTVPASGAFGAGVYRVFDYGGALTDNGLSLGAMPAGSNVAVQTSIAGQVNLVNSAGLTLNFWDGAAGPKNDGVIQGGSGIWQNSTGNDNWTNTDGTVNAAYSDGAFAVFGGAGGTVTVDDGLGAVTTSGMQFVADGYTIEGDAIALTGAATTIRVGDGSTAGADTTATIDAALTGDSQLVKTDAGTLILAGTNSYTGGTAINGGAVQVSADANLGDEAGDVTLNGGTLATTADLSSARAIVLAGDGAVATAGDTTFTFEGLLSGPGALTKQGAGTLLLTGDNSGYTAATTVAAGTLAVDGVLGGAVGIDAGARLAGSGRVGDVTNAGVIAPGRDGFGTLTVGAYAGNGGVLEIETALGGDTSETDRLVVTGGTSGSTEIAVTNRGGLGAQTVEGVKLVDLTGGVSDGAFTLRGDYLFEGDQAVIAGAYGYRLYQGGVSTPSDGDWYLRSALLDGPDEPEGPLYQPGVPVYENYAQTLQTLNGLPTLQERVGNRRWAPSVSGAGNGIWGRMESNRFRPEARGSTTASDLNVDSWQLLAGYDRTLSEGNGGLLVAGLTAHYGKANGAVRSIFGDGSIHTKGYGIGATLTWYAPNGFYADGQAQFTWFDGRLKSSALGTLADDNDGEGRAVSLEVGKRSPVGGGLTLTPQIQMSYQNVDFDTFDDPSDARVSPRNGDSLKTRWGISIDHDQAWDANGSTRRTHLYGLFNLNYEWLDGTRVDVSGTPIRTANDRLWGEAALGGSMGLGDRLTIYTQVSASSALRDFGDSYSIKGTAGVRLAF